MMGRKSPNSLTIFRNQTYLLFSDSITPLHSTSSLLLLTPLPHSSDSLLMHTSITHASSLLIPPPLSSSSLVTHTSRTSLPFIGQRRQKLGLAIIHNIFQAHTKSESSFFDGCKHLLYMAILLFHIWNQRIYPTNVGACDVM